FPKYQPGAGLFALAGTVIGPNSVTFRLRRNANISPARLNGRKGEAIALPEQGFRPHRSRRTCGIAPVPADNGKGAANREDHPEAVMHTIFFRLVIPAAFKPTCVQRLA